MEPLKLRLSKIPISLLILLKDNPPARIEERKLKELEDKIIKTSLIVPPIVVKSQNDNNYLVLDGNRRITILKKMGTNEIQCNIIESLTRTSNNELFVALNTQLKMDGSQRLTLMRNAGLFFSKTEKERYFHLVDIGGTSLIDLMITKRNNVMQTYHWTYQTAKYLNKTLKVDIGFIAFWLVWNKQQYQTRKAIEMKLNKKAWWELISSNLPLKGNLFN